MAKIASWKLVINNNNVFFLFCNLRYFYGALISHKKIFLEMRYYLLLYRFNNWNITLV